VAQTHPRVSAFLAQPRLTGERGLDVGRVTVVFALVSHGTQPPPLAHRSPGAGGVAVITVVEMFV
jgi:hypothetical protein